VWYARRWKKSILLNHYGIDLYLRNQYGETALHVAVAYKQLDYMRKMLQCDDDSRVNDGDILFKQQQQQPDDDDVSSGATDHRSIDRDRQQTRSSLVIRTPQQQSRLIDCQDNDGQTALHVAVRYGLLELLPELLNWKPNLEIELIDNPLELAAFGTDEMGDLDMVRCLIEHPNGYGGDLFMCYRVRARALCLAIEHCCNNLTLIEYLSNITDLRSRRDIDGNTALHLAIAKSSRTGNIMSVLLRNPYAMEAVNICSCHSDTTVLHDAIFHGQNSDTVLAIAKMANVNLPDRNGKTPLHYAVASQNPSYVRILLDCKADVCIRDHNGNTAFVLACCDVVTQTKETQLSKIYELYQHGIVYGELSNMV